MPDMSNIDTDKMEAAAKQLEGVMERIGGSVKKFGEAIERLDRGWVSDVKDEFFTHVQRDAEALREMMAQLIEVSTGIVDAAQNFTETENEISASIKAL